MDLIGWLKTNPNKASEGFYSVGGRLMNAMFQKGVFRESSG